MEFNVGQMNNDYIEEQDSVLFTNKNFTQKSIYGELTWQYFIIPPFLDIGVKLSSEGLSIQSPEDQSLQFKYHQAFVNAGILFPRFSDFVNIRLVGEYYYTKMVTENDSFGLSSLYGWNVYPEIEILPFGDSMFLQISPYAKVPLIKVGETREELTYGLKIKVPLGSSANMRFPLYAYQKALIFKVFYTATTFDYSSPGLISSKIEMKQLALTVGFNF